MRHSIQDKRKAIELRKKGLSYKEIQGHFPFSIAKSTLSGWFRHINFTDDELKSLYNNLKKRENDGRYKAALHNRNKRIDRDKEIVRDARNIFKENVNKPLFLLGIALYWAEGTKKSHCFQFINSDPEMIIFMVNWIEKYLDIPKKSIKYRLFIHLPYKDEGCENYWLERLSVPIESFEKTIFKHTAHSAKKNPSYKGCLRISVPKVYYLRFMIELQSCLKGYIQ